MGNKNGSVRDPGQRRTSFFNIIDQEIKMILKGCYMRKRRELFLQIELCFFVRNKTAAYNFNSYIFVVVANS